ncbi:MAG: hypothetical protein AB1730_21880 [Myxococcota bacterium]|jgi:hypothetical protein
MRPRVCIPDATALAASIRGLGLSSPPQRLRDASESRRCRDIRGGLRLELSSAMTGAAQLETALKGAWSNSNSLAEVSRPD